MQRKEDIMADTIKGPVTRVIDGDTFDMDVTHVGKNNKHKYKNSERIRIASIDAPELRSPGGRRSKDLLAKKLKGKKVRCSVQSRDTYGRIVADVHVL
jgi:endonuclease YncB( thermonuclease family)